MLPYVPSWVPKWGGRQGIGEISRAYRFPYQVSFGESVSLLFTSPFTTSIGQTGVVMQEPRMALSVEHVSPVFAG